MYHLFPDVRKVVGEERNWIIRDQVPEARLSWQCSGWLEKYNAKDKGHTASKSGDRYNQPVYMERSSQLGTFIIADKTKGNYFLKYMPP